MHVAVKSVHDPGGVHKSPGTLSCRQSMDVLMHQDDMCAAKASGAGGSVTEDTKSLGHVTDHERCCE